MTLQDKLERADKLVSGLAGEFVRWQASIGTFEAMIERLVGDSLIAAAFLSYAGTFDTVYRCRPLKNVVKSFHTSDR